MSEESKLLAEIEFHEAAAARARERLAQIKRTAPVFTFGESAATTTQYKFPSAFDERVGVHKREKWRTNAFGPMPSSEDIEKTHDAYFGAKAGTDIISAHAKRLEDQI